MALQRIVAHDRNGIVRREVAAIVGEHDQAQCGNQSVGVCACDEIDLVVFKRAIEQPEIHDARRCGELQLVGADESVVSVAAFDLR